jgi:hypothetical protein
MLASMGLMFDAIWRAAICVHPRVIALSLLPLILMAVGALVLGYFFGSPRLIWLPHGSMGGRSWSRFGFALRIGVGVVQKPG